MRISDFNFIPFQVQIINILYAYYYIHEECRHFATVLRVCNNFIKMHSTACILRDVETLLK